MATIQHGDEALRLLARLREAHAAGLVTLDPRVGTLARDASALLDAVDAFRAECDARVDARRAAIMREIL